jgi:hypothetical protein
MLSALRFGEGGLHSIYGGFETDVSGALRFQQPKVFNYKRSEVFSRAYQLIMRIAGADDEGGVGAAVCLSDSIRVIGTRLSVIVVSVKRWSDSGSARHVYIIEGVDIPSVIYGPRCWCVFQIPLFLLRVVLKNHSLQDGMRLPRCAVADVGHKP